MSMKPTGIHIPRLPRRRPGVGRRDRRKLRRHDRRARSPELGAWSRQPGAWILEPAAWSLEPGPAPRAHETTGLSLHGMLLPLRPCRRSSASAPPPAIGLAPMRAPSTPVRSPQGQLPGGISGVPCALVRVTVRRTFLPRPRGGVRLPLALAVSWTSTEEEKPIGRFRGWEAQRRFSCLGDALSNRSDLATGSAPRSLVCVEYRRGTAVEQECLRTTRTVGCPRSVVKGSSTLCSCTCRTAGLRCGQGWSDTHL